MLLRQRHAGLDQHIGHGVHHRRRAGEIPFEFRHVVAVHLAHDLMDESGAAGPRLVARLGDRRMEMNVLVPARQFAQFLVAANVARSRSVWASAREKLLEK